MQIGATLWCKVTLGSLFFLRGDRGGGGIWGLGRLQGRDWGLQRKNCGQDVIYERGIKKKK